jgi:hypothetical protein
VVPQGTGRDSHVIKDRVRERLGSVQTQTRWRGSGDVDNSNIFCVLTGKERGVKCPQKGEYLASNLCRLQRDQGTRFNRSGDRALQHKSPARESAVDARQLSATDAQFGEEQREFYNPNQQKYLDVPIELVRCRTKWEEGRQRFGFRRADGELFRARCGGEVARLVFGDERKFKTREAD